MSDKLVIEDVIGDLDDDSDMDMDSSDIDPNPLSPSSATHDAFCDSSPLSPSVQSDSSPTFREECVNFTYKYVKNYVIYRKPKRRSRKKNTKTRVDKYRFSLPDRYGPKKLVGEGAYGFVISAFDSFLKQKVAIKVIHLYEMELGEKKTRSRRFHKCILRELLILKHFRGHENLIGLKDVYLCNSEGDDIYCVKDDHGKGEVNVYNYDDLYVVSDLMDTDLYRLILNESPFHEDTIKRIIFDCLKGLKYIHSAHVFHRDIKPQNILISKDNFVAKICDFGLSRGVDYDCRMSTDYVITRWYRPPEILMKWEKADHASDIWSIGCVMAELCSGLKGIQRVLFKGNSWVNQLERIIRIRGSQKESDMYGIESAKRFVRDLGTQQKVDLGRKFSCQSNIKLGEECLDLLDKLLDFNPIRRVTAAQALKHPWFVDVAEEEQKIGVTEMENSSVFTARITKKMTLDMIREMIYNEVDDWKKSCAYYNDKTAVFIVLGNVIRLVEEEENEEG